MTWDEAAVARLKELHARGWSASEIGADLGTTRNAVIGKIDRLGLNGVKRKDTVKLAHKLRPRSAAE